mgnify:CR=1 FL=1
MITVIVLSTTISCIALFNISKPIFSAKEIIFGKYEKAPVCELPEDTSLKKAYEILKKNLDLIAEKSGDFLLLPIGADHLGIPHDIREQITAVNKILKTNNYTLEKDKKLKPNFVDGKFDEDIFAREKAAALVEEFKNRNKVTCCKVLSAGLVGSARKEHCCKLVADVCEILDEIIKVKV